MPALPVLPPRSPTPAANTNLLLHTSLGKEGNVLFNHALDTFYLLLYGRKEMFYLTTHSTLFIYGYMVKDHSGRKEGNVLFNDALDTFYLWLYVKGPFRKEGRKCYI